MPIDPTQSADHPIIVSGWDGSTASEDAILHAAHLAERLDGRLHVLLVWDYLTQPQAFHNAYDHQHARADVTQCTRRLQLSDSTIAAERLGIAHEVLPLYADEQSADYVVIGRTGRGGVLDRLFGTTASRVVRNAPCAVMIVPSSRSTVVG